MGKNLFRVHNDFIKFQMGFLSAVEFNYFICILYHLGNKGSGVVVLDRYSLNQVIDKKYLNYRYNACMKSMRDKLEKHGFIGKGNDALFSRFDLNVVQNKVKSFTISINESKSYLINNVKTCYFNMDLGVFQSLSTFTAKALYCWHCRNKSKDSFFIASSLLKGCVGINFNSTSGDAIKIKNALKCLGSVGIVLSVKKNKSSAAKSSLYNITFYKENMAENNPTKPTTPAKENDALTRFRNSLKKLGITKPSPPTPPTIKKADNSEIKDENDALTRFRNSLKKLGITKPSPTIPPTIKKADNSEIKDENDDLAKYENIILTSPKYFDCETAPC
ncbi:RepB family plasmid replication initiator protein [Helicobacter pylori]|uniref:RepB family plasmid replication initiator protein n=1 Tax=Helicobacter pylori TaxID=210 RepID=UPI000F70A3BD|nr:RepB family plasmid replication initiator protein [Helicobacter pylori]MCQ2895350.1 RepB family plasmid replication initiator protein [Helicobacter pylori]VEJ23546.1 replication initiation protein A [Helicobacter pylori]